MRLIFLALVVFALVLLAGVVLSRGEVRGPYSGFSGFGLQGMPTAKHFE
jgi:hypothetical protein